MTSESETSEDELDYSDIDDCDDDVHQAKLDINLSPQDIENISGSEFDDSESCTSNKKRVTFQTGENLVLVREIPPRGFDSSGSESDKSIDSNSDLEEESSENDDVLDRKIHASSFANSELGKINYGIRKPKAKTMSKIMKITSTPVFGEKNETNNGKKKITKRRIKSANAILEPSKNVSKSFKTLDKTSSCGTAKLRVRSARSVISTEKDFGKISKSVKGNEKAKSKSSKFFKSKSPKKIDSMSEKINILALNDLTDTVPESAMSANDKLWKLFDSDGGNCIETEKVSSPEISNNKTIDSSIKHDVKQSGNEHIRQDVRSMNTTDRRLYSWLMANGSVPSLRDEVPSISLMWGDTSNQYNTTDYY